MEIDLHNFFKYFDEKNPKHVAAVEELENILREKHPNLIQDSANWVRVYRTKLADSNVVLDVPFYSQLDNYTQKDKTCNSSCCAMVLEYLLPGTLNGLRGDDAYLKKVLQIGDSTDHTVQTKVLNSYGVKSEFFYNLNFEDLDREISEGVPVVAGILHRGPTTNPAKNAGHMIVIVGKKGQDYVVHDPFGSLLDGYTGSADSGRFVVYPRRELQFRWAENSRNKGWGRIFETPVKK